jgi:hypothetical protein
VISNSGGRASVAKCPLLVYPAGGAVGDGSVADIAGIGLAFAAFLGAGIAE